MAESADILEHFDLRPLFWHQFWLEARYVTDRRGKGGRRGKPTWPLCLSQLPQQQIKLSRWGLWDVLNLAPIDGECSWQELSRVIHFVIRPGHVRYHDAY
jgi:hypothetical protein